MNDQEERFHIVVSGRALRSPAMAWPCEQPGILAAQEELDRAKASGRWPRCQVTIVPTTERRLLLEAKRQGIPLRVLRGFPAPRSYESDRQLVEGVQ